MKMNIWSDCKKLPLTEVLSFIVDNRGKTVPTTTSGHILIATNCIKNDRLYPCYEKIRFLSEDTYQSFFRSHPIPGDILFVCKGTPGRCALVPDPIDFCIAQDMVGLRTNKSIIDNKYLLAVLRTYEIQKFIYNTSVGDVIPHFKKQFFNKLLIPVPPMELQTKIGAFYYSISQKIENNNKINANLEAQAQALFKSWFVDFTPFKDQPFVDSELGPIPQGWKVGKLGDYCETICRGLTPKYNLDSKEIVLGQTCVRNNIVTLNNARKHQPKGKTEKKVQQWDTLINSTGIGSLGRVGIVYFDYNYVSFDSHITVVRATNPLLRPYIGRNLVSRQLEIENLAIGSTGQTELPRESVKSITLYIPTQKVLESFNCIIKPLSLKILKNIQENLRLAALRDTLLPKLMSGEIKL